MNIYTKSLVYLGIFSLLHFGFDLTNWAFLKPFCGIDESVFQHLKMAFWSYLMVSLIEYFVLQSTESNKKNTIVNKSSCMYSRLFSTLIIPWIIVFIWYLVPALYGKIKVIVFEILWAVAVTYISGIGAGLIEKNIEKINFTFGFKIFIILMVIISAFLYVWFTYVPPWIDVFMNPEIMKH